MPSNHEQLQQLKITPGDDNGRKQRKRNQQRWAAITPTLALMLIMLAYAFFGEHDAKPAPAKALPVSPQAAVDKPVTTSAADPVLDRVPAADLRIKASGYVVAQRITTVSSSVAGVVRKVLVREGQKVEAGQLLAELENHAAKVKVERSQKDLQAASYRLQQSELKQTRLLAELGRFRQLAKDGVISASQLADAELDADLVQRQTAAEQNQLALARDQLKISEIELSYSEVRAPFSGVVTELTAQVGETVSPIAGGGGYIRTGICTIVDLDSLQVEVDVNEKHLQQLSPGQQVTIGLDAYDNQDYHGQVSYVVPVIDKLKGAVRVKVAVNDFDDRALPGMAVRVWLQPAALVATTQGVQ